MAQATTLDISREKTAWLKILAALSVMVFHYMDFKVAAGSMLNPLELYLNSYVGHAGMALFFFLSGYGLMKSDLAGHLPFRQFLQKRVLRIYLPSALATALWLLAISPKYNISTIGNIVLLNGDLVVWFIKVLIGLYVGFYLYAWAWACGRGCWAEVILWVTTTAVMAVTTVINGRYGPASASVIPLFAVGVVAATRRLSTAFWVWLGSLSAVCIGCVLTAPHRAWPLDFTVADYAAVALVCVCASRLNVPFRAPALLSLITFDLYLVHYKVLMTWQLTGRPFNLILFLAITLVVAWLFFFIRTKLLRKVFS